MGSRSDALRLGLVLTALLLSGAAPSLVERFLLSGRSILYPINLALFPCFCNPPSIDLIYSFSGSVLVTNFLRVARGSQFSNATALLIAVAGAHMALAVVGVRMRKK